MLMYNTGKREKCIQNYTGFAGHGCVQRETETDISTGSEIERWTRQKRERERERK